MGRVQSIWILGAGIAGAWLLACSAGAQTVGKPSDTWSDITQVVVRAKVPGPAMWKLSKGPSTVWVLGTLHVAPRAVQWDSTHFQHVLQGAHVLILPRVVDDFSVSERDMELPGSKQLKDVVSPQTYQRFQDIIVRENLSSMPTGIAYGPAWAGSWLIVNVYHNHNITTHITPIEVANFAAAAGVALKYVDRRTSQLQARQYERLDTRTDEACLNDYLDSIDHDLATVDLMGDAWARGDVATILANHREPAWVTCFLAQPEYARTYQTYAVDDMVKAIDKALKTPGKSVAVLPLSDLLRKDGILDRLRAEGVEITSPAE